MLATRVLRERSSGTVARPMTTRGGGDLSGSAHEGPDRPVSLTAPGTLRSATPAGSPAGAGQAPHGFDVRSAYREHGGILYGFVLNALGDRGLAEDCVQETFLRAWRARDGFDATRGSERTWLFAIARNVVVDAARARSRRLRNVPTLTSSAPGDLAALAAARAWSSASPSSVTSRSAGCSTACGHYGARWKKRGGPMHDHERRAELLLAAAIGEPLGPDDTVRLEQLLAADPTARKELDEIAETLSVLRRPTEGGWAWDSSAPPSGLEDRILAATEPAPTTARSTWRPAVVAACAAGLLAVGAAGGWGVAQLGDAPPSGPPGTPGVIEPVAFAAEPAGVDIDAAVVAHTGAPRRCSTSRASTPARRTRSWSSAGTVWSCSLAASSPPRAPSSAG